MWEEPGARSHPRCARPSSYAMGDAASPVAGGRPDSAMPTTWSTGNTEVLTDSDNLVLLCRHHHRVAHQDGWRVEFDGRDLQVFRPDGTEVV